MPKTILSTTQWECINVNCMETNVVGPCPNCGNEILETANVPVAFAGKIVDNMLVLRCKRCEVWWRNLKCKKCGSSTPLHLSGLPTPYCFIATAVYESPYSYEVLLLRQYRDRYLSSTTIGRLVICLYYKLSPPLAEWLSKRSWAKYFARKVIMPPFLWMARRKIGREWTSTEKMDRHK